MRTLANTPHSTKERRSTGASAFPRINASKVEEAHSAYHRPRSLQAGRRTCNRYFPAFIKYVTIRGARRHFPMRNYALSYLLGDG